MISAVTLENYKAHANTRVELGRITMLVGPNGAGKTSVLEALERFALSVDNLPENVFAGPFDPNLVAHHRAAQMRITLQLGPHVPALGIEAEDEHEDDGRWTFKLGVDGHEFAERTTLRSAAPNHDFKCIANVRRYHLDPRAIAEVSINSDPSPRIPPDGSHTATVLTVMKLEDDERFRTIEAALTSVVPHVKRIHPHRSVQPSSGSVGYQLMYDFTGASRVVATSVSDGTLVTTALLTILLGHERPRMLLLDDVEQGLHPSAQRDLMRQLNGVLNQEPQLRIVATTHSPYILDALEPEDVRVFALRPDGTAGVKKLSEHPEAEKMKGSLTTGQLWSLDEEASWVLGTA